MTTVDASSWQARWDELKDRAAAGEPGIAEWLQAMEPHAGELGIVLDDGAKPAEESSEPAEEILEPAEERSETVEEKAEPAARDWAEGDSPAVVSLLQEFGELSAIPAAERTAEQTSRLEAVSAELDGYGIGSPGMLFRTGGTEPEGAPADLDLIAKLMGMPAGENATEESISAHYEKQTGEALPDGFFSKPFKDQLSIIQGDESEPAGEAVSQGKYDDQQGKTILNAIFGAAMAADRSDMTVFNEPLAELGVLEELGVDDVVGILNKKPEELVSFIADIFGMDNPETATKDQIKEYYKEQTGRDLPDSFWSTPIDYSSRAPFSAMMNSIATD